MKREIDPEALRWTPPPTARIPRTTASGPRRTDSWRRFIKGPIPYEWVARAAALPGKALHVAIMIQFHAGVRSGGELVLSLSSMKGFGVSRHAAARGLSALERAGLVAVNRAPGRAPRVTLRRTPPASAGPDRDTSSRGRTAGSGLPNRGPVIDES